MTLELVTQKVIKSYLEDPVIDSLNTDERELVCITLFQKNLCAMIVYSDDRGYTEYLLLPFYFTSRYLHWIVFIVLITDIVIIFKSVESFFAFIDIKNVF